MATSYSLTDLRRRLAEALRQAEGGEPVVITRHGKPAAALIGAGQLARLARPPVPAARVRDDAPGVRLSPAGGHSAGRSGHRPGCGLPRQRSLRQGPETALRGAATSRRELEGRLPREAAERAVAGRAPVAPRHLAGVAGLASGTLCGRCGEALEPEPGMRVSEGLAPLCDRCAGERAPQLAGLLAAE